MFTFVYKRHISIQYTNTFMYTVREGKTKRVRNFSKLKVCDFVAGTINSPLNSLKGLSCYFQVFLHAKRVMSDLQR